MTIRYALLFVVAASACSPAGDARDDMPSDSAAAALPADSVIRPTACDLLSVDDVKRATGSQFEAGITTHAYMADSQCRFNRAGGEAGVLVTIHGHGNIENYRRVPGSVAVENLGDGAFWNDNTRQLGVRSGEAVFSISFLTPPAKKQGAIELARKALAQLAVSLRTDSTVYTLKRDEHGWGTKIGFTYRNTLPDTVYILNCNGHITMELQKLTGSKWTSFWHGATDGCMSAPILVLPGESYRGELSVWAAEPGATSYPTFASANFDGSFRLLWHQPILHYTARGPDLGETLPEERRRSNEFTLRKAAGNP